jgi:hypothetical protein
MTTALDRLRFAVRTLPTYLSRIPEAESESRPSPERWTKKEVVTHSPLMRPGEPRFSVVPWACSSKTAKNGAFDGGLAASRLPLYVRHYSARHRGSRLV